MSEMSEQTTALGLRRFDYATYERLLARVGAGRENLRFCDWSADAGPERFFILRHDVDLCPAAALRMAEFEHERGLRATYFLLMSGHDYNLLSPEHCALPARLVALGHEVGLHYDAGMIETVAGAEPEAVLEAQAALLGRLAGTPVRSISMHNPSVSGADPFRATTRYVNAYDERLTRRIGYFSDSCGAWRDSAVAALEGDLPARLQLLVHPFFWDHAHADRRRRLEAFVDARREHLERRAAEIKAGWEDHAGVREHDARER